MSSYRDIIIAPIITEKSASLEAQNTYVFKVDIKANKTTIQIDNTGKVTISAEEKVELTAKKGMLLTSKDDFKLDASGKNITFTCSEFNVNDGNLKVT